MLDFFLNIMHHFCWEEGRWGFSAAGPWNKSEGLSQFSAADFHSFLTKCTQFTEEGNNIKLSLSSNHKTETAETHKLRQIHTWRSHKMTWWHSDFFFMMDHFFTFLWQSMKTLSSLNWWTTKMHPCKNVNDYRRRPTSFTLLTQFFPRTTHFSTTFEHLEPATPCHLNSIAKRNRSHDTMQGGFGGRVGRF